MTTPLNVLIVEDNPRDVEKILDALRRYGREPIYKNVYNIQTMNIEVERQRWDLILCNYAVSQDNGLEMLRILRVIKKLSVPLIFLSDNVNEEDAANLISFGAQDFVPKNNFHRLMAAIKRGCNAAEARRQGGQIESRLESEQQRLRQLMANIPDLIAFKDSQRRYTHVNDAACRIYNREEKDILGQTIDVFDVSEHAPAKRADEESILATGQPVIDRVEKLVQADGTVRWFSATKAPIRDHRGAINGLIVIARDITKRIQDEEEYRVTAERFTKVLELAGDAIVAVDEKKRVIVFNQEAERIFGHRADEAVGQSLDMLLPSGEAAEYLRHIIESWDSSDSPEKMSIRKPIIARRKNGEEFRTEVSISKFIERGEAHFIAVFRDITSRLQLENRLAQSQKMEAIGQLTGGIAHDFNNLLLVIIGNLDLLNDMTPANPTARELIETSLAAALSGADLSNGLLAFSRQQTLHPEQMDTNALVLDHVNLLKRALGGGVAVETVVADDAFPTTTDPTQLRCVLTNLAVNARDAMPKGGTLTIRTYNAILGENDVQGHEGLQPGDFVVMEVCDTGTGISPENLQRIFEPFFTTKDVGKGTGLGLSMVYGFVKQSNGKISVSSEVGKGTAFRLYLPRAMTSAEMKNETMAKSAVEIGRETILVVDDDAIVRKAVLTQLNSFGYSTIEASSASEALDVIARKEPFDLLFTDIVMPGGMNGIELARVASERKHGLKVLLTSGFPDLKTQHDPDSFMRNAIIKKPYRRAELQNALREVLDNR